MKQRNFVIGILLILIASVIFGCTRRPSRSRVTDDITFDEADRTHGSVEFVRVDPDGSVVLKLRDVADTVIVRSSGPAKLPNGTEAAVIASDHELQTATIRASGEAKDR